MPARTTARTPGVSARADLIADTALTLLAERGMRGLTHRAVDERAGLPQGSTSNHARTRQALLESAVLRLAELEARVLAPGLLPEPPPGPQGDGARPPAAALAQALHAYLTGRTDLLVCRYELALEATRRPELRAFFDAAGRRFREPLVALMTAAGSAEPERHALSVVAWSEGMMFSCAAGAYHGSVPTEAQLRTGYAELLRGMLGADGAKTPVAP
ncbi:MULTISPECIES: TetR/AcrR family transcriptional regulator [unclassified Streptomyces]|uniref:TetR/AcrR family transcriptional regulator n=1 Tax=Streptomyces TaxID=1883 RepID=UPI0001C19DB1|nr:MULTISPECIES: TetR/AcrR family transcriptional regulator [unclassified Streptomyces]AEN08646.1 transcriptional regulator, TetR family [Streptomyces sp. SirexAA-E]MYR69576.1 TetR family transcriptional regulator [Streptomyces sp. SID4939]MYS01643.1 TetR family transcriptional regulator [Streptomyces sp. SID4940]MYT66209.1 TetR family transcriptional regulator [Streptomyces sp. SID8357]MYT83129.1 TetR family transcriptional regulator [Streptomyces sp. SID8360]